MKVNNHLMVASSANQKSLRMLFSKICRYVKANSLYERSIGLHSTFVRACQASPANDTSCESVVTSPQIPLRDASNPVGPLSIAEETFAEFLSKATGTAVYWVQIPGMKPGLDSTGIVAIS